MKLTFQDMLAKNIGIVIPKSAMTSIPTTDVLPHEEMNYNPSMTMVGGIGQSIIYDHSYIGLADYNNPYRCPENSITCRYCIEPNFVKANRIVALYTTKSPTIETTTATDTTAITTVDNNQTNPWNKNDYDLFHPKDTDWNGTYRNNSSKRIVTDVVHHYKHNHSGVRSGIDDSLPDEDTKQNIYYYQSLRSDYYHFRRLFRVIVLEQQCPPDAQHECQLLAQQLDQCDTIQQLVSYFQMYVKDYQQRNGVY